MLSKILIIGHARHGKDTVAEMMAELFGLKYEGSSMAASRIFIFDALKNKHNYQTPEQCFTDRVDRRPEWFELICEYNKDNKARLARKILKTADCYVGMRSNEEVAECRKQGIFDFVIGVYNPREALEPETSFNIDIWNCADVVIPNAGTLADLRKKVALLTFNYRLAIEKNI